MPAFRALLARPLFRNAVISAALTLLATAGAVFAGITPASAAGAASRIETEVIVLFVPLAVLMVAITAQALRMSLRGVHPEALRPARMRTPLLRD